MKLLDKDALNLLVPVIVALLGWYIVNAFDRERDLENKQREYRTEFLIEAYRSIEQASNRKPLHPSCARNLEEAVGAIQLLGSQEAVDIIRDESKKMADKGSGDFTPLLKQLRKELREELALVEIKLKKEESPFTFFRMDASHGSPCYNHVAL